MSKRFLKFNTKKRPRNVTKNGVLVDDTPLILDFEDLAFYNTDPEYGDKALEAIRTGRQILIKTPNADGGNYVANYSPVYMYQIPNYENNYLYLFYLRDEKQTIDLSTVGLGTLEMPVYGELKMLLSKKYMSDPLNDI